MTVGIHIIADLYGVDEELISTSDNVIALIEVGDSFLTM